MALRRRSRSRKPRRKRSRKSRGRRRRSKSKRGRKRKSRGRKRRSSSSRSKSRRKKGRHVRSDLGLGKTTTVMWSGRKGNKTADVMISGDKRRKGSGRVIANRNSALVKKLNTLKKNHIIKSYKFNQGMSKHYDGSSVNYPHQKHVVFTVKI